jgi:hypothetical protein
MNGGLQLVHSYSPAASSNIAKDLIVLDASCGILILSD